MLFFLIITDCKLLWLQW